MTNLFFYFWIGILGLIFGSFFNVVALRDDRRKTIISDRSECPHCHRVLRWFELIPLVSFLIQGGRCRRCRKLISWRYPLVELITAGLFVLAFWYGYVTHGSILLTVTTIIAISFFLIASLTDIQTMQVDLQYIAAGGVIGFAGELLHRSQAYLRLDYAREGLIGLLIGGGLIFFISLLWKLIKGEEGMGEGDMYILGAMGLIVGYRVMVVFAIAVFIGALVGVILLATSKKKIKAQIPFGPSLFIGFLGALIFGQAILDWYLIF